METLAYELSESWDETIGGKIVAMSPRPSVNHNIIAGNIYRILGNFFEDKSCTPFSDGVDLFLTPTDRFVPDGMVVCNREIIKPDGVYGAPDLVIEVLSPGTAKRDRAYKKNVYEKAGVKEYWIVDVANKSIEVYILQDAKFELDNIYSIFPDYDIAKMTVEERKSIPTEFSCSIFPELEIPTQKIFAGMF